jgi:nickel-dependent lactate racemase
VALLTGDRFTDQMLGPWGGLGNKLLDYLNRLGIRDEDVTLVYAPGSHPSPHWRERLGPELLDRVRAIRHDCYDEESLAYLGVTRRGTPLWVNRTVVEADFRLAIGEISPNVQGGWCGGGKIILPGVAGWDSIEQNHYGVVHEVNTLGLADGNPMRLDMEEAAWMAGLDFKIDVMVDSQARFVAVSAGDPVAAHRAGLERRARQIWMTRAPPADVYVLYPGQGSERHLSSSFFIRIEGAELGTKEDGVIILALSAAGGWAPAQASKDRHWISPERNAALFKEGTEALVRAMVRREANVRTCSMLYTARRVLERRTCFLVCDGISPQEAGEYGFRHCTPSFDEALDLALEQQGRNARITVNNVSNAPSSWLGRPVAWRAMPWREG